MPGLPKLAHQFLHRCITFVGRKLPPANRCTTMQTTVRESMAPKQTAEGRKHWVFLGFPGVGKGTYASKLSNLLNVPHIATGDLVRKELDHATPLGQKLAGLVNEGQLIPGEAIFDLLSKRLEEGARAGETGFILDGFPRTLRQAKTLAQVVEVDMAINLTLREDILIAKCLGRRVCSECGRTYNLSTVDVDDLDGGPRRYMPPLLPPTECASKLIVRPDDREEVVRDRLHIHAQQSKPVEVFYRTQGKLIEFNVAGEISEIWSRLLLALKIDHEEKKLIALSRPIYQSSRASVKDMACT